MEVQLAQLLESKREIQVCGLQEAAAVGGRMDVQHVFLYYPQF